MLFVTTTGAGSLDRYSQELAARLDGPKLYTDVYQAVAERFNVPLLGAAAIEALGGDIRFIRRLRAQTEPIHLPNHHLARYGRFVSVPYIVTVHDLIRFFDLHRRQPLIHRPNLRDRVYLRLDVAGIRRAQAIIAVSQTTKYDLVEHLGIPPERVSVVYEGVDHERFYPVEARPYAFPYILFVGSEHPRKNLPVLFEAFAALKARGLSPELKLVKVGAPGGKEAGFRQDTLAHVRRLGIESDVVFTGHVPDDDLRAYYSGAVCTVMPSLYEGFGLPTVEAMACGSAVIVSSGGSLPEIAGDAALVVSPRVAAAWAQSMGSLLEDSLLRSELQERALRRASAFSWDRAAEETLEVYRAVGSGAKSTAPPRRYPR
jgi:glycosyltransferase involved in cell wall biosynthesis